MGNTNMRSTSQLTHDPAGAPPKRRLRPGFVDPCARRGPLTAAGKARAAQNARRHGLSIPVSCDPPASAEIEALAQNICRSCAAARLPTAPTPPLANACAWRAASRKRRSICAACAARGTPSSGGPTPIRAGVPPKACTPGSGSSARSASSSDAASRSRPTCATPSWSGRKASTSSPASWPTRSPPSPAWTATSAARSRAASARSGRSTRR